MFVIAFGRVIANHHEANWEEAVKNAEVTAMHCVDLRRTILELLLALPIESVAASKKSGEEEVRAEAERAKPEKAATADAAKEEAAGVKAAEEEAACCIRALAALLLSLSL